MAETISGKSADRGTEWFVPKLGPPKFRFFIGLLFLPYTAMVLSFAVIGAITANDILWSRVLAIVAIYFLGLGIAAHALDAVGSKQAKPWGSVFTRLQLWLLAAGALVSAYLIAGYYMVLYVPWLWVVAILEGFFVFAYNLEWFAGKFHTDYWFAFSWGFLPVLAGRLIQTNTMSLEVVLLAASMSFFSYVEIKASRPYKELKRSGTAIGQDERLLMKRFEMILKSVSLGVIFLAAGLMIWRAVH
jgi:hypothetical protein